MSCWVHWAVRSWGFDGGEGVAGGVGGLVSVRFVLQEDWSVAAPRVPTATHTSAINHTQPESTERFVFPSFHTSAASCHHPEKRLLQNYQEVRGAAGAVLKLQGMYVFQQGNAYSKVAAQKQDTLLTFPNYSQFTGIWNSDKTELIMCDVCTCTQGQYLYKSQNSVSSLSRHRLTTMSAQSSIRKGYLDTHA